MPKLRSINPSTLKQPTKSYSNGILLNLGEAQLMFVTGQVAQDLDGNVVAPNDAEAQTKCILDRISDILADADMTLDHVVKAQIFVTNMDDSAKVSKVRDQAFLISKPVSTLVEVSRLMKPEYCVEIEVIAAKV